MNFGKSCCILCRQPLRSFRVRPDVPYAKLTSAMAREIRERYAKGDVTQPELAAQYSLRIVTIMRVLRHLVFEDAGGPRVDGRELGKRRWDERAKLPCVDCQRPSNWNGQRPKMQRCSSCYAKFFSRRSRTKYSAAFLREHGITLEQVEANAKAGKRWCVGHREFHRVSKFAVDLSREDGLRMVCREWAGDE